MIAGPAQVAQNPMLYAVFLRQQPKVVIFIQRQVEHNFEIAHFFAT
jgi:hypothetical protein